MLALIGAVLGGTFIGFTPNVGGTGTVNDADPRLGGQFRADWVDGRWHIGYPYC